MLADSDGGVLVLAFALVLDGESPREARALPWGLPTDLDEVRQARGRLVAVHLPDPVLVALGEAAAALGVDSPRAVMQALRVARAHCAWRARSQVDADDAAVAAHLVLAPRATRYPVQEAEPQHEASPPPPPPDRPPEEPSPPEPPQPPEGDPPADDPPVAEPRADDFHFTRLQPKRQSTTIFAVDASGSSALHRLAEAKGAVELLLADCYVRRDQVAVIAFRGCGAELLLPPTRSLVRAKRVLNGLPGGGSTPLAAALDAARTQAVSRAVLAATRGSATPG